MRILSSANSSNSEREKRGREMEGYVMHGLLALSILQLFNLNLITPCTATYPIKTNTDYIKTSCKVTRYPRLCYNSLSIYAGNIQTNPKALAHTALNVTLAFNQATSVTMKRLSQIPVLNTKESAALLDCVEKLGDAGDQLQKSVDELGRVVGGSNFGLQMSNIQTWVSAALTNEDSCMDGFAAQNLNGKVEINVHGHIEKTVHLTSNALALINSCASA